MTLVHRKTRRGIVWVVVLLVFLVLLVLANEFTEGERFYGVAPAVVIGITLLGLIGLYRATADSGLWIIRTRHVAAMTTGAAVYALLAYAFNELLALSIGPVPIRPQVCIPILLGYVFTPPVGFFSGAVGSLMGDFIAGWGVFPAWHIGSGLTGLVPGLVALVPYDRGNLRYLSRLVVVLLGITAAVILIRPRAPEAWTGEIQDYSFWAWLLVIAGLVMAGNSLLLEQVGTALTGVNLWGTLGILVGNGFAATANILVVEYSIATAVIAEFAPAVGIDVLNLMVFAPLIVAGYQGVRRGFR